MQAHTDPVTDMHTYRHSQTDRQIDRQTHTHTHIEPSPWAISLSWSESVQSCVCETSDPAWGRIEEKAIDQGSIRIPTRKFVTANAQSNIHACLYLPTDSIPKIKAQLRYNGRHTDIILSVCMVTTLPQSELPKLTPTCMSLSTSPYSPLVLHGL